jgi:Amt family ammonium transporter
MVFAATSVTIVSGAVDERLKFQAYLCYAAALCLLIYPIYGHWAWSGGWLGSMGALDFAVGTIIHINCGFAALASAIIICKRRGCWGNHGILIYWQCYYSQDY